MTAICAYCLHPEKDHCKGDVSHSTYKDQMRMVPNPKTAKCVSRHCTQPICSCVDFKEVIPEAEQVKAA